MNSVITILVAAVFFAALVTYLAVKPRKRTRLIACTFFLSAVGGLILYGIGYAHELSGRPMAILRTVIDVVRMFGGNNSEDVVIRAVGGEDHPLMYLFWVIHFLAYYTTASAALIFLGSGLLSRLRLLALWFRDVDLIYGVDEDTLALARRLSETGGSALAFVGDAEAGQELAVRQMGALLFSDAAAQGPEGAFLRRLNFRSGKRKLRLYAISRQEDKNLAYALKLLDRLQSRGVRPEQTALTLLGKEELYGGSLQSYGDRYGYGSVTVFEPAELSARLLLKTYTVSDAITFDQDAAATEAVEALLVGFGELGQEVLRKLAAGGQFEGSSFHAAVFDPDCAARDGFFRSRYATMLATYSIDFHSCGGRSRELYEYLGGLTGKPNYVVVALEDKELGREVALDLLRWLKEHGAAQAVYQCARDGIVCYPPSEEGGQELSPFRSDLLLGDRMDGLAKRINHYYWGKKGSEEENWARCDYFSRMSCRASADYLPALLARTGTADAAALTPVQMENLAKSEHLRWCAFHYAMGYAPLTGEELRARAAQYPALRRFTKDTEAKRHACLIPWDELDGLSSFEKSVTGGEVDYKQKDRENIEAIRGLLRD